MYLKITYEDAFDDLYMHLRSKYPSKLFDIEGIGEQTDMSKFSKKFFSSNVTADVSIDANANVDDISVIAYDHELPKPFFKLNSLYILWKELKRLYGHSIANDIIEKQIIGDIYIHDLHGIGSGKPYCFNYSTYDIMAKGLPMVNKIKSFSPKYLYSFKSQLEQFTVIASNSTLGATGLADLLVVMSYYVKNILKNGNDAGFYFDGWFSDEEKKLISKEILNIPEAKKDGSNDAQIEKITQAINDKLGKKEPAQKEWFEANVMKYIKENIVSFIYTINQPMRANQSPFTNLSIYDRPFLESLCEDYLFPDGSSPEIKIINQLQELYLDIMNAELRRTPITFPVTTACFSVDEDNNIQDNDFVDFIARKDQEFGFINIYCGDSSTLSSCCRLRSEKSNEYFNSFGSGSSKIGSLGVCSINFPRLAILSKGNKEDFFDSLQRQIDVCAKVNNAKRHIVKKRIDNGNLPLYTHGYMELSKQYSTVGVNGLNECVEIMGHSILEKEGQDFTLEIIHMVNEMNDKFQKQYGAPHNCEQIPFAA